MTGRENGICQRGWWWFKVGRSEKASPRRWHLSNLKVLRRWAMEVSGRAFQAEETQVQRSWDWECFGDFEESSHGHLRFGSPLNVVKSGTQKANCYRCFNIHREAQRRNHTYHFNERKQGIQRCLCNLTFCLNEFNKWKFWTCQLGRWMEVDQPEPPGWSWWLGSSLTWKGVKRWELEDGC